MLSAVFGDMEAIRPENRNMLWLVFASPSHRAAIPNWEIDARAMLARFRIEFGRHQDDRAFLGLIDRLRQASDEFDHWWPDQDVSVRQNQTKRFAVDGVGDIELEQSVLLIEEAPDVRLVIYTPVDMQSAKKVRRLQRQWMTRSSSSSNLDPDAKPMRDRALHEVRTGYLSWSQPVRCKFLGLGRQYLYSTSHRRLLFRSCPACCRSHEIETPGDDTLQVDELA